jgi:hypothetical protein
MNGLLVLAFVAVAAYQYWWFVHSRALLRAWAAGNHFDLLKCRRPWFFIPWRMWFTTSKAQAVFQVTVFDPSVKRVRTGWVRFGSYWTGLLDDEAVDVTWDHPTG